jgi:poly(3-hydroxyalkanoate) synthetase
LVTVTNDSRCADITSRRRSLARCASGFKNGSPYQRHHVNANSTPTAVVEPGAFTIGETVAATDGSVALRNEVFELIQHAPQAKTAYPVPPLMIPH